MENQFWLEVIKTIGPTAIVAVYMTYRFGLKQKKFDLKHEHYKKIRVTAANLLSIWFEFSTLEKVLQARNSHELLIYQIPELTKHFLQIDEAKVERLNIGFSTSLENLKEIDIGLYYLLDGSMDHFHRTNNELLYPLLKDEGIDLNTRESIILPLLIELLEDLEEILRAIAKFLGKKERHDLHRILERHKNSLASPSEIDVPQFITNWINHSMKPVHKITSDDLAKLYNNPTAIWVLSKILTRQLIQTFSNGGFFNVVKMGLNFPPIQSEEQWEEISQKLFPLSAVLEINITEEEDQNLVNNRPFYHLLMGIIFNVSGQISFEMKRYFVKLNNGEISIKTELDTLKQEILFEQFQQNYQTYD